jgi:hypothetical protein
MSLFETTSVSITKFDTPESDGFVADSDTSFREQIFNIAKTEVESMVEPDGIADDIGWESVPLVRVYRRIIDQRRLTCQYPAGGAMHQGHDASWTVSDQATRLAFAALSRSKVA